MCEIEVHDSGFLSRLHANLDDHDFWFLVILCVKLKFVILDFQGGCAAGRQFGQVGGRHDGCG